MKRFLALILAAVMLLTALAGCSKKEEKTTAQADEETQEIIDPSVLKQAASVEITYGQGNHVTGEGVYYFTDEDMNTVRRVFSKEMYTLRSDVERDEKHEQHNMTFYDKDGQVLLTLFIEPGGWLFLDDGRRFESESLEKLAVMAMEVIQHQREEAIEASASVPAL